MRKTVTKSVSFSGGNGYQILVLSPGTKVEVAPATNLPRGGFWIEEIYTNLEERDQEIFESLVGCMGLHLEENEVS